MTSSNLDFLARGVARIALALPLLTLSLGSLRASSSGTENAPYVVIENGTSTPVKNTSGLPKKSSGETVYLSSAVQLAPSAPKPTPKPKPVATPKPTPAPKPTPTPKPSPATKAQAPVAAKTTATAAPITVSKPSGGGSGKGSGKGSASDDELDDYKNSTSIADPIQPVNRGVFWFNHQLYHYAFHPLCKAYKAVLPSPVRTGIYNVFDNLEYPVRFVNDILQWQPKRAGLETEKFLLNSTVGVAGIFKPSSKYSSLRDIPKTDTGITLAKWGIPEGCYIVWPVLGPKSVRDTVGFAGDLALYPVAWVTYGAVGGLTGATTLALSGPDAARTTSDKLDTYENLTHNSIDRYTAVRSAYEQNRKNAVSK